MVANTVGKGKYESLPTQDDEYCRGSNFNNAPNFGKLMTWDHIQNLDQFFTDIYKYHQVGGFYVLLLIQLFWLIKFMFVVFITVELSVCTNWTILANHSVPIDSWSDVFIPPRQCWASLPLLTSLFVSGAVLTIFVQLVVVGAKLSRFWQIRRFCTQILDLPTTDVGLADFTWSDVQHRLLKFQRDFQLCVYKLNLDELDIYNRILRHTNYLIAMVNRNIIPLRFHVPFVAAPYYVYLPNGYLFNLKLILFRTPWSPFQNYWQLRTDYKWVAKRHELAAQLATRIRLLGVANLVLCPVIFVAQLIMLLCANAERLRYQPNSLFGRQWSNYARLYLRHFNELKHEFVTRVSQAYIPASRYLDSFASRSLTAVAETCVFLCGGASMAFLIASMVRDQMMHLPGFLAILVGGGILARASNALIPDENVAYCPKNLLISTLMRIHYMPDHWKENAGTHQVRFEFSQLFQYRMVGLLEEMVSPIITPIILIFFLPNCTLEIIDFLRNYTVEVPGVGDVCSFAQLDIRRHGDPLWHPENDCPMDDLSNMDDGDYDDHGRRQGRPSTSTNFQKAPNSTDESYNRCFAGDSVSNKLTDQIYSNTASVGKTELSLMHFHLTNPTWRLPPDRLAYLKSVRQQALLDFQQQQQQQQHIIQTNEPVRITGSTRNESNNGRSSSGLFSTLYGNAGNLAASMHQSIYHQTNPISKTGEGLKNISHLPGACMPPENSLGVVGAMIESMHRSDTDMNKSQQSNLTAIPTTLHSNAAQGHDGTRRPMELNAVIAPVSRPDSGMVGSQLSPLVQNFPTPVNMSLMAASALNWAENPTLPFYQPYNSQTEDGLCQQLGINSSLVGSSRPLTDVLTADISVSALYMHELYHRRLQQRRIQNSGRSTNAQHSMIDSAVISQPDREVYQSFQSSVTPGSGIYTTSGFTPSYQIIHTTFASNVPNANMYVRAIGHRINADERTGMGSTLNYNYGSLNCDAGIIRTPCDGRRIPSSQFTEVREEDENVSTPRSRESAFPIFAPSLDSRRNPSGGGIVTLSGSPSIRPQTPLNMQTTNHGLGVNPDVETDAVQVWPDLPPTNC